MTRHQILSGVKLVFGFFFFGIFAFAVAVLAEPLLYRLDIWLTGLLFGGLDAYDLAPGEGQAFADSFRDLGFDLARVSAEFQTQPARAWIAVVGTAMGPIPADLSDDEYRARFAATVDRLYPPSPVSLES